MKKIIFIFTILITTLFSISGCKKAEFPDISVDYALGQLRGGGIVAYVDATGQHGLICTVADLSTGTTWANAKTLCTDYRGSFSSTTSYNDWRLPSATELQNIFNATEDNDDFDFDSAFYWSSTEVNGTQVTSVSMSTGNTFTSNKTSTTLNVIAVRSF